MRVIKRHLLIISSASVVCAAILALCLLLFTKPADKTIPYLPLDINNIDKIALSSGEYANEEQTRHIISYINSVKTYVSSYKPEDHPVPGPINSIRIYTKDGKYIIITHNYDGRAIISDSHIAYVLRQSVINELLNEYSSFAE